MVDQNRSLPTTEYSAETGHYRNRTALWFKRRTLRIFAHLQKTVKTLFLLFKRTVLLSEPSNFKKKNDLVRLNTPWTRQMQNTTKMVNFGGNLQDTKTHSSWLKMNGIILCVNYDNQHDTLSKITKYVFGSVRLWLGTDCMMLKRCVNPYIHVHTS